MNAIEPALVQAVTAWILVMCSLALVWKRIPCVLGLLCCIASFSLCN